MLTNPQQNIADLASPRWCAERSLGERDRFVTKSSTTASERTRIPWRRTGGANPAAMGEWPSACSWRKRASILAASQWDLVVVGIGQTGEQLWSVFGQRCTTGELLFQVGCGGFPQASRETPGGDQAMISRMASPWSMSRRLRPGISSRRESRPSSWSTVA